MGLACLSGLFMLDPGHLLYSDVAEAEAGDSTECVVVWDQGRKGWLIVNLQGEVDPVAPPLDYCGIRDVAPRGGFFGVEQISTRQDTGKETTVIYGSLPGERFTRTLPFPSMYCMLAKISPDGRRLAVPTRNQLHVVDLYSGKTVSLTGEKFDRDTSIFEPSWDQKGERIAFYECQPKDIYSYALWIVDASSGAAKQLTERSINGSCFGIGVELEDQKPSWDPSGGVLYFTANFIKQPEPDDKGVNTGKRPDNRPRIYRVSADGTDLREIAVAFSPALSDDGNYLYVAPCGERGLGKIDIKTGKMVSLVDDFGTNLRRAGVPRLSVSGDYICQIFREPSTFVQSKLVIADNMGRAIKVLDVGEGKLDRVFWFRKS